MADDFESLLDEALADPEAADYAALRESYADSVRYLPFGRDQDAVEDLHRRMAAEEWEQALDLVEALLSDDPLSISLRFAYAHILEHLDDEIEASAQRTFGNGLLRAVLSSGDGRSPESAMRVLDTREMYLVVEILGLRAERTQLSQVGTEWVELVEVKGGDGERGLYFNVSLPQSWLAKVEQTEEVEIEGEE
jgi:Domain of unknown function (DUF4919)